MGYGNIDRIDQYFISSSRLVAHAVHGINPNLGCTRTKPSNNPSNNAVRKT